MSPWMAFQFQVAYASDQREEKIEDIWIDLLTYTVSDEMKKEVCRIVYQDHPIYAYPIPSKLNIHKAFSTAYYRVKEDSQIQQLQYATSRQMEMELDRIITYYNELLDENKKRTDIRGLTEEKKQEIKAKSVAIEMEKAKQMQDIKDKFSGQVEISLNNVVVYFIPTLEYEYRTKTTLQILYYNLITKRFMKNPFLNVSEKRSVALC